MRSPESRRSLDRRPRAARSLLLLVAFSLAGLAGVPPDGAGVLHGPRLAFAQERAVPDRMFRALEWRNIGPWRGGRAAAAAGVPSDPRTYYLGTAGGGVWKTADGGETWRNVSDGFFGTASVGAVAVAPSDPSVVYAGTGEHPVRGVTTSHGDGVYRSVDAGKTWTRVGLEGTRAVSRIRVHPRDPELVYVAAQGAPHGASGERGVYRSSDGGESWEKVLGVSERAGASDLAMDMTNPRILYAAFWDHLRRPWVVESGGTGSGVWKSTDGGDSWNRIEDGLPARMGKIGISVSRANPERVYAIVEAEGDRGGLYRSDDAGGSWELVNSDRVLRARSWYYMEVYADPGDEHTVYVLNAPMLRSHDGGRSFERISSIPHGDTHDLWINPRRPEVMINANDGGGTVTFNGGESWSTLRNQPTAQIYRVNTDARYPYRVYGGQQDNSTVEIRSAAAGGIGWKDWHPVSGCESAYLAFDPEDPEHVYGGCYQGQIERWDRNTGESKAIMAYPYMGLGMDPRDMEYRFNWNAPIVASPHDPSVIYHAANVLLRTGDGGRSWEAVSPDLTRDEEEKQGAGGGPITNEAAGGEVYNTIMYVEPSPHEAGTIWVGSDDGLVHLTRNGGDTWTDVTPEGLGEGMINSIEASPHDPAKAYVVFTRYKFDDFTPHVYRTEDRGGSWTRIADGTRGVDGPGAWVRVVREDPVREGLLYAGTEAGMYLSLDDGARWRRWQLDLPVVPVTDLEVRRGDLVASTQGRGFWILDDLSPLRQVSPEVAREELHLFAPRTAIRWRGGRGWGGGFGGDGGAREGENPPSGAVLHYAVADSPRRPVKVEILDAEGSVVRTYATDSAAVEDPPGPVEPRFTELEAPRAGLNRLVWDFRHEPPLQVPGIFTYGEPRGRIAAPGVYTVRVALGGDTAAAPLEVAPDPRRDFAPEDFREQDRFLARATRLLDAMNRAIVRMRDVREQVRGLAGRARKAGLAGADALRSAGDSLAADIEAWEAKVVQPRRETFQDVINFPPRLSDQLLYLIGSVDGAPPPVTEGTRERLADLRAEWEALRSEEEALLSRVEGFNRMAREAGAGPVVVPR